MMLTALYRFTSACFWLLATVSSRERDPASSAVAENSSKLVDVSTALDITDSVYFRRAPGGHSVYIIPEDSRIDVKGIGVKIG